MFRNPNYWRIWSATILFFVSYYLVITTLPNYLFLTGFPNWEIGLVVGASGLFAVAIRPGVGILSDRWSKTRITALGGAVSALGITVFLAFGAVALTFIVLVLAQATAYVSITTSGTSVISDISPQNERAYAIAIYGTAAAIAICFASMLTSLGHNIVSYKLDYRVASAFAIAAGVLALLSRGSRDELLKDVQASGDCGPRYVLLGPMGLAFLIGAGFGVFFLMLPLLALKGGVAAAYGYVTLGLGLVIVRLFSRPVLVAGRRKVVILVAYLALAAGLGVVGISEAIPTLILGGALVAVGLGILHPAVIAEHIERVSQAESGRATSRFYIAFDMGIGLGVYMLVPVFQLFGIQSVFLGAAVITFIGAPATIGLLKLDSLSGVPQA